MGGGASSAAPSSDTAVEIKSDGTRVYTVKVVEAAAVGLKAGMRARLTICEEELDLLTARGPVDDATLLARFDYRAIPSWSITPKTFAFRFRPATHRRFLRLREPPELEPEPEPEPLSDSPVNIRLGTLQAAQISAVLREHCYKKADEIRRMLGTDDGQLHDLVHARQRLRQHHVDEDSEKRWCKERAEEQRREHRTPISSVLEHLFAADNQDRRSHEPATVSTKISSNDLLPKRALSDSVVP